MRGESRFARVNLIWANVDYAELTIPFEERDLNRSSSSIHAVPRSHSREMPAILDFGDRPV